MGERPDWLPRHPQAARQDRDAVRAAREGDEAKGRVHAFEPDPHAARLLALLAASLAPARLALRDAACDSKGVARVVAIGDVHGAFDNFVAVLQLAGLVDASCAGAEARPTSCRRATSSTAERTRKAMDLLMRLERSRARRAGRCTR